MEDEFDDRTYANNIIQGRAISDALARLADGINLLDKELHSQVRLPSCRFSSFNNYVEGCEGTCSCNRTRNKKIPEA